MIRQISHKNIKMKSRQKSKTSSRPSQSKHQPQARPTKIQTPTNHITNHIAKPSGNPSKPKTHKYLPQKCKLKPTISQKMQPDNHALYMKGNLKQLMNKNMAGKQKSSELVPQLLKNIEKHCKELKKINEKQKCYQKRVSLQENKLEKERKWGIGNKSHDQQSKKKNDVQKQRGEKEMMLATDNRFSLQINPLHQLKQKADPMTNERICKKAVQHSVNEKNFVELFKIYKKSFEIEDLKIEKSNKNTNYNTNQSKNSSSIFNSAHGDLTNRNKIKTEDKINLYKIQNLIKSQQKSISKDNSIEHKQLENKPKPSLNPFDAYEEEVIQSLEQRAIKNNQFIQVHQASIDKVQIYQPQQFRECLISREKSPESYLNQSKRQEPKVGNVSRSSRSHEVSFDKDLLEKKFQSSKFYVQPIPSLRTACQNVKNEEDSLVGCEITLIENNVICEDSELMSLEL